MSAQSWPKLKEAWTHTFWLFGWHRAQGMLKVRKVSQVCSIFLSQQLEFLLPWRVQYSWPYAVDDKAFNFKCISPDISGCIHSFCYSVNAKSPNFPYLSFDWFWSVNRYECHSNELRANLGIWALAKIKAALMKTFLLTMAQITVYDVKEVARGGEPTENYHPTLQFPREHCSAYQLIAWLFVACSFTILVHSKAVTAGGCFQPKSSVQPAVHHQPSTKRQTDKHFAMFFIFAVTPFGSGSYVSAKSSQTTN